jgi:hypothetical protein
MNEIKKMGALDLLDFDKYPVWQTVPEELCESGDDLVQPVLGKLTICDGDTDLWVRFSGFLADGTVVEGIAMAESPPPNLILWSFRFGDKWLALNLSPAPEFVLKETGPLPFARSIDKRIQQVFPILIQSEVKVESTGNVITKEIRP